ncbi:MAG: ATP-binding protein [Candidatus Geothermincolia bacterium]
MRDSTKNMSKMVGTQDAETAVHLCMYMKYIAHYVYNMGKKTGLVQKEPATEIPLEVQEMLEIYANKVSREIVTVETSTYHGKVLSLENAEALVTVQEDVEIRDLSESIIPYPIARDIVLENPKSIAVAECACRSLQNNPCLPLDVCMMVGEPFVSFVVDNNVMNARRISQDEAVEILRAEHKRGHVHGAFFKDVADGRFYAICNCCPCCCLGMQAWNKLRLPMICASGYRAEVGEDCTGCGDCAEMCPFFAIEIEDEAVVDSEKCMGCGVCEGACDTGAIRLVLDPSRGEPLNITELIEERRNQ